MGEVSKQETSEKKGLLKQLAGVLGFKVVEKGAMAELYEERSKGTLFWNAMNTLEEVLYSYDNITGRWRYETDEGRVRECLEEFVQIITSILTGKESITKALQADRPIEKAGKKMSGKNKETLAGIYESLGLFLKEFDEPEDDKDGTADDDKGKTEKEEEEKEVTKQEVSQIVEEAIAKAMGTADQDAAGMSSASAGAVAKAEGNENTAQGEITPEAVWEMVEEAIAKTIEPPQDEAVTVGQVQEMIAEAVAKAVDPILKSRGLPSNLNASGSVEKSAEQHYLHGIL